MNGWFGRLAPRGLAGLILLGGLGSRSFAAPRIDFGDSEAVRDVVMTGNHLGKLLSRLRRLKPSSRRPALLKLVNLQFPEHSRIVHFADVHISRNRRSVDLSTRMQRRFIDWMHQNSGTVIFTEGLSTDVDGPAERTELIERLRLGRRPEFALADITTQPPVPRDDQSLALYYVGGPFWLYLTGHVDRIHGTGNPRYRRALDEEMRRFLRDDVREVAALIAIERYLNRQPPPLPQVVLVFGAAHYFEDRYGGLPRLAISTAPAEIAQNLRVGYIKALFIEGILRRACELGLLD